MPRHTQDEQRDVRENFIVKTTRRTRGHSARKNASQSSIGSRAHRTHNAVRWQLKLPGMCLSMSRQKQEVVAKRLCPHCDDGGDGWKKEWHRDSFDLLSEEAAPTWHASVFAQEFFHLSPARMQFSGVHFVARHPGFFLRKCPPTTCKWSLLMDRHRPKLLAWIREFLCRTGQARDGTWWRSSCRALRNFSFQSKRPFHC